MAENKETEKKEVKKVTLGLVLGWLFGGFFLLSGFLFLFTSFVTGMLCLLIGVLIFPPANSFLVKRFNLSLSKGLRIALVIALLVLIGIIGAGEMEDDLDVGRETEETVTTDTEEIPEEEIEEVQEEEVVEYTEVNMTDFLAEYDKNKLAAEKKWTGERIQTTGYISNISSVLGKIYVSIEPSDDEWYFGNSVSCYPKNSEEEERVLELENGQVVTVRGVAQDMSVMSVGIKDCEIVQ
jgi:hypothetical protein